MPDALSPLIAKLGDCPKTEEYIETPTEPSRFGKAHLRDLADAALLELAEKVVEARDLSICIFCGETMAKDLSVMLKHAEGCEKRPENRLLKRAGAAEDRVAELEAFKRDVCRRASQDQHGWSAWVANWERRADS